MTEATSETPVSKAPEPKAAPLIEDTAAGHSPGGHGPEGHGANGHGAYPFLAHHFDTPQQQFDAGKLGIWLFLVQEVLFFAGLFCAYTAYRAEHPEIFVYAHYHLDTTMGAVNTCVLLISSLTAAWAVRNAQLGEKKQLILNIWITLACAFTFLGVKYVEYSHKAHEGTLWGRHFDPQHEIWELDSFKKKHPESAELAARLVAIQGGGAPHALGSHEAGSDAARDLAAANAPAAAKPTSPDTVTRLQAELARAPSAALKPLVDAGVIKPDVLNTTEIRRPEKAPIFFGIYFFMTGLHGVHVIAGIIVWFWMLAKAYRGQFGPNYFGPIDFSALYWHLVDLVWIYLFPLLYLIH